jgi:hypothetical protein
MAAKYGGNPDQEEARDLGTASFLFISHPIRSINCLYNYNESNKNIFYIIFSQIDTYILRSENLKQIILCYFRFA